MQNPLMIFNFIIFIFSIIVHEVAHGLAAEREGDPTARLQGRITLNPLKHIDWFGSVILPLILILSSAGVVFGWAKPVEYNPENVRRGRKSVALISIAGILTNLGIALVFGTAIRVVLLLGYTPVAVLEFMASIVGINIILALFNAIPIAPLDGFRFLSSVLPARALPFMRKVEQFSLPILIVFIFFGWKLLDPVLQVIFRLFTGA